MHVFPSRGARYRRSVGSALYRLLGRYRLVPEYPAKWAGSLLRTGGAAHTSREQCEGQAQERASDLDFSPGRLSVLHAMALPGLLGSAIDSGGRAADGTGGSPD